MSVNIFKNGILSKIAGAVGDAVPLINNFLTNQAGKGAADANTVYVLNNKIEELNNSLTSVQNILKNIMGNNPLIPTMTSNTTPSGNASASSAHSNYPAYYAFDNNDSTVWLHTGAGSITNQWVMYKFTKAVQAIKFDVKWVKSYISSISYKIQGSNDGAKWTDLTANITSSNDIEKQALNNDASYIYYRLYINSQTITPSSANCGELAMFQLYGY